MDPLQGVWGIDPGEYPEDEDDDLPDFGGPEEDEDEDWEAEFDDDDPYLDE